MSADGTATRQAIMDSAEGLVLEQGFAGTSVDAIIGQAGVTKGAFFHHFESKQDLAYALIDRYVDLDLDHLTEKMARAEALATDPLQQLLVFVGLFIEDADAYAGPPPGCLMGSYIYEAGLFDERTMKTVHDNMMAWREVLVAKLEKVAAVHPPAIEVDFKGLADMLTVVFEGAYIVARSLRDPDTVADQLEQYRSYIELLFGAEPTPG